MVQDHAGDYRRHLAFKGMREANSHDIVPVFIRKDRREFAALENPRSHPLSH
jgi:hypothetical protein